MRSSSQVLKLKKMLPHRKYKIQKISFKLKHENTMKSKISYMNTRIFWSKKMMNIKSCWIKKRQSIRKNMENWKKITQKFKTHCLSSTRTSQPKKKINIEIYKTRMSKSTRADMKRCNPFTMVFKKRYSSTRIYQSKKIMNIKIYLPRKSWTTKAFKIKCKLILMKFNLRFLNIKRCIPKQRSISRVNMKS